MNATTAVHVDEHRVDEPEHRSERRRFLIFALMAGYTEPVRVAEGVVAEISKAVQ